jgi:hypothetical protein
MRPSSGPGLQKEECLKLVNCNLLVVRDPVTKEVFFFYVGLLTNKINLEGNAILGKEGGGGSLDPTYLPWHSCV